MTPSKKNALLWMASAFSVVVIFKISYGLKVLIPTNINWLMSVLDDWGQHYLGWFFYRNEPWHFPLGHIDNLYYPLGTNVGFTDSIPLLCIFFKLFAPLLPADFQFLGIWLLLCHLLAAYYTIKLLRLFNVSRFITFLGVLIVAGNPVLIYRGMHPALCAHWLLIGSFYSYFTPTSAANVNRVLYHQFILLMVAILVNPYIGIMVSGLSFVTLVKVGFFDRSITRKRFAGSLSVAVLSILVAWWLVGFIEFTKKEDLAVHGGYGPYGLNLNSLYNPQDFSRFLPNFGQVDWYQFEGYMYLGLGVMLLLFVLLILWMYYRVSGSAMKPEAAAAGKSGLRFNQSSVVPLLIFLILVTLFSITNVVTLNKRVLFRMPAPAFLLNLGDVFRASARFFWIPYYLILLFSVVAVTRFPIKVWLRTVLMILIVAVQLYDTSPMMLLRKPTYGSYDPPISKSWSRIMQPFDNIVFYPPFEANQLTRLDYQYFCFLAARNRKAINIGYVARSDGRAMNRYSDSLNISLDNDNPIRPHTLYITTLPYLEHLVPQVRSGFGSLNTLDGYFYVYSDSVEDEGLRSLSGMLNARNKAKLDSGLILVGRKTEFHATRRIPDSSNHPLRYWFERLTITPKYLSMLGWGFIDSTRNNTGDSTYITLSSDTTTYVAAARVLQRHDLSVSFSRRLDDAGFKDIACFDSVAPGSYRMGIAIKDHQGRWIGQLADTIVNVSLPEYATAEKLDRLPPEGKITYWFDEFNSNDTLFHISGWAFIDGQSAEGSTIRCVLKNDANIYTFETVPVRRPDLTITRKSKYDLRGAGFGIKALKKALSKGKYRVGFLIKDEKSSKELFVSTDKSVDIP